MDSASPGSYRRCIACHACQALPSQRFDDDRAGRRGVGSPENLEQLLDLLDRVVVSEENLGTWMGAQRLPMRRIREILRLKHESGLSQRAIAQACGVGLGTVSEYLRRAAGGGLGWPLPPELDEAALEANRCCS